MSAISKGELVGEVMGLSEVGEGRGARERYEGYLRSLEERELRERLGILRGERERKSAAGWRWRRRGQPLMDANGR